jgi:hypothetical protein
MRLSVLSFIVFITVAGCTTGNSLVGQTNKQKMVQPKFTAGPQTLVYKTRKDYGNNVPVLLSDDKTKIVSYPDPKDFNAQNGFPKPAKLKKGYLLDNRGIGINVAYLKLTYVQYAALPKLPSQEELMKMIIDKDPLTELINCGNRYAFNDVVNDLNVLIQSGQLKKVCKVVK